jgi:glycine cleavage system H protein
MSKKYSKEHEWIQADGDTATVGITNHAQEQLGELVFVQLPEVGQSLAVGDEAATVESVKAASEVYAVVSGTVLEVNEALNDAPETVNASAEDEGWLYKVQLANAQELDTLMDATAYAQFVEDNA